MSVFKLIEQVKEIRRRRRRRRRKKKRKEKKRKEKGALEMSIQNENNLESKKTKAF